MDGKNDYKVITSDAGQTAYAKAVAEGLIEFLGLEKKKVEVTQNVAIKSTYDIVQEVIAGKWGNGNDRKNRLAAAGYNYSEVQAAVNAILKGNTAPAPVKKSNEEIAKEVIAGKWGNGADRKKKLQAAGYDYSAIQKIVNKLLK